MPAAGAATTPGAGAATTPGAGAAWHPASWRARPAAQQPDWPDGPALDDAVDRLRRKPPLVFAGEARALRAALARVAAGRAVLLQAGDCAESFDVSANQLRDKLRVILQMAVVLTYGAGLPVVKVGRIAGQFAKPRSADTETRDGVELPSFRGHIVNDPEFSAAARAADPSRLLDAYHQAAASLNLLRAFATGGFADLTRVHAWNQEFVAESPQGESYEAMAAEIDRALRFMAACGVDLGSESAIHQIDLWTSHEALLLPWEEALTRRDSLTGDWYDCSAHLLWAGERTRAPDGAHVEFLAGVHNPVGVKLGPTATPAEVVELCARLDPDRTPGRLLLIARMGAEAVTTALPALIAAVRRAGHPVAWVCDPMHGNTFTTASGYKTRRFDDVMSEIAGWFAVHRAEGSWPGGIHVELTGDDVTECLGGSEPVRSEHLTERYETMCDPRLNARQSLDLAFRVAAMLRDLGCG